MPKELNDYDIKLLNGYVTPSRGFKNYIIDGDFNFWYEGTSQTSSGYGSDTMWRNQNIGSTKSHDQHVLTNAERDVVGYQFEYASKTTVASVAGAGNLTRKRQLIEGVKNLAGKNATWSFWAKADSAKNIAIELAQSFGTGGTPSTPVLEIGVQHISLTTEWQKFEITIAVPSISGKTLGTNGDDFIDVSFWFEAGSDFNARTANLGQQSGTFWITGVQLEENHVATHFDNSKTYSELGIHRYYLLLSLKIFRLPAFRQKP